MTLHVEDLPVQDAYLDKHNRDKRAKELKELGFVVRRSRMNSVIVDSRYVKDYAGVALDKKYFAVIYIAEGHKKVRFRGL